MNQRYNDRARDLIAPGGFPGGYRDFDHGCPLRSRTTRRFARGRTSPAASHSPPGYHKICAAREPSRPLPWSGWPRCRAYRSRHSHRLAGCRESPSGALADAVLCDPLNRRTTPPRLCVRMPGHRARRSTAGLVSSCPVPGTTPAPVCRRHAVYSHRAHVPATQRPAAAAVRWIVRPSRRASNDPDQHPRGRKSGPGGAAGGGHSILTPARAPGVRDRQARGRSVDWVPAPARSVGTRRS